MTNNNIQLTTLSHKVTLRKMATSTLLQSVSCFQFDNRMTHMNLSTFDLTISMSLQFKNKPLKLKQCQRTVLKNNQV